MIHAELLSFAKLLNTQTSRNLVRVFFLREKLKKQGKSKSLSNDAIKHLHVIGTGAMGGDIAGWCALQGLRVSLHDTRPESIAEAIGNATKLCENKHLSSAETRDVLDRLIPDPDNSGVEQADLVLEAVPEDLELKLKIHTAIEPRLKPGAILATNTSSILLEDLRGELSDPTRLVGIHFFNPVAKMQLVEVVNHSVINATIFRRARQFVDQIGKLPVPVASAPGFLVNRALTPYLVEAICLLDEGVPAEAIDKVAIDFGMPMGPIELADQVGLDVCIDVADMLRERVNAHQPETPEWLRSKVEKGHLGRKTGKGLYIWSEGKPKKRSPRKPAPKDTLDRLILPMLNACMACLREEVVADAELLDGAMIFATGFAPFTGGPLHYAQQRGVDEVIKRLHDLQEDHGERFAPDPGWSEGLLEPSTQD
jgi:3-hydroxyacyl-CoA dehydrogenase/enoyl-CoA hydratase/3-hydroxybutyryl-CoA epimerase